MNLLNSFLDWLVCALAHKTLSDALADIRVEYGPHLFVVLKADHNEWVLLLRRVFGWRFWSGLPLSRQHNLKHTLQHKADIFIQCVLCLRSESYCFCQQRDVNWVYFKEPWYIRSGGWKVVQICLARGEIRTEYFISDFSNAESNCRIWLLDLVQNCEHGLQVLSHFFY